ncbi:hypothetical protein Bbelb_021560 [Branchiostoma belcheri]|nr:hypothetical protein Bbelb_021560 [Branchiostoma belcheri]
MSPHWDYCGARITTKNRKQKVCINESSSRWGEVYSGVPQGSVLGPVLFTIYVNDMPEVVNCSLKLFADDTKLLRPVPQVRNCEALQQDLTSLQIWADKWQLKFHPDKCTVLRVGSGHPNFTYNMSENNNPLPISLKVSSEEEDLGILVGA